MNESVPGKEGKMGSHFERLKSAYTQILCEIEVKSSWNHELIVLAQTRSGQKNWLRGSYGFNFWVEWGECRGLWGLMYVYPQPHLPQKACTYEARWTNGFCSSIFCCCSFDFLNNLFAGSLLLYVEYFRKHTTVLSVSPGSRGWVWEVVLLSGTQAAATWRTENVSELWCCCCLTGRLTAK